MVEAKNITFMWFSMYVDEIFNTAIHKSRWNDSRGGTVSTLCKMSTPVDSYKSDTSTVIPRATS